MKLLLYCTKSKPYLYRNPNVLPTEFDAYFLSKYDTFYSAFGNKLNYLNGKIVAECDFEVEKIFNVGDEYEGLQLYTETLSIEEVLKKSCLSYKDYLGYVSSAENYGYAIHIKNLHIFDEPKELEDTEYYNPKDNYKMIIKRYKHNNNYMRIICLGEPSNPKKIFLPVHPEELCRILNGEQDIIIRKIVLKEML